MAKKIDNSTWEGYVNSFSSYEGTITNFCKENNISKSQFYYHRRRVDQGNQAVFHAVSFNSEVAAEPTDIGNVYKVKDTCIRIEIGNANIYIPTDETTILTTIIKELAK